MVCDSLFVRSLRCEVAFEQFLGGHERTFAVFQNGFFVIRKYGFYVVIAVETVVQSFVDAFVHPIFALSVAVGREIAVFSGEGYEIGNAAPYVAQSGTFHGRTSQYLRAPPGSRFREEV